MLQTAPKRTDGSEKRIPLLRFNLVLLPQLLTRIPGVTDAGQISWAWNATTAVQEAVQEQFKAVQSSSRGAMSVASATALDA